MSCATRDPVAASPKPMRSTSVSERRPLVPVTPQRSNVANRMRVASSPLTPSYSTSSVISSPFTPITNVYSSSSSLISPNSSVSTKVGFSPEPIKVRRKSIADTNQNWRSRAKENGIKVDNDELSYARTADSLALNPPQDFIPSSFLSTHKRPRQALFQSNSADGTAFISPKTARLSACDGPASAPVPSSLASSVLNTPESNRSLSSSFTLATPSPRSSLAIVQRLRQRGSVTDPARPRNRRISGPIFGEALFDIDEDSITNAPFPDTFGSPIALRGAEDSYIGKAKRCVSAPFIATRFYQGYEDEQDDEDLEDDGLPVGPKPSRACTQSVSSQATALSAEDSINAHPNEESCSVCSASSSPLSVLVPCEHLICSSCLTSSLNIVGEKDMHCATCDKSVDNFRLLTPLKIRVPFSREDEVESGDGVSRDKGEQAIRLLPSAIQDLSINYNTGKVNKEKLIDEHATQKPRPRSASHLDKTDAGDIAVLRIDNVPWDVTPTSLNDFFSPYTLIRAHVLLDPKGKTLSHAYVEIPATEARNALRSVQNKSLGKGRRLRGVTVTMSSQSELMRALFPSWLGGFDGAHPTLDGLDRAAIVRTLENGLITLHEVDNLLALMKNPKSHFLKVATLPFYSLTSILSKFPVEGDSRVFWSSKIRDVLYGATNTACDLLTERLGMELHDQHTLESTVSTAIDCNLFTDIQRFGLFSRVVEAVSEKGGQLSCGPPIISATSSAHLDDACTRDDGASTASVSTASILSRYKHNGLDYGKPSVMRQNTGSFGYNGASSFNAALRSGYTELTSHQTVTSSNTGSVDSNPSVGVPFPLDSSMRAPYDMLAREFNVEPDLVAALAQRLVYGGQAMSTPGNGSFIYVNGGM